MASAKKAPAKKAAAKKAPAKKAAKKVAKKKPAVAKKAAKKPALTVEPRLYQAGEQAEEIGDLEIPTGLVVVSDAGTLFAPVAVEVTPGTYRVRVVKNEDGDNESAALVAKDAAPVRWKEVGAYPVDAGMSGFFDGAIFARADQAQWKVSIYDDLISKHLDPAEKKGHAGAFVPFEEAKFSACRSGWGDGVYPVYAGHDAAGEVVAVVTRFFGDDDDD